ncbi:hypothetical protein MSIBF_A1160003 [groundwater metagenome]|uniref:Uncharacterized protein n=1 Tax=groundwater metagenome TaxID=717931 RepID=A0A098E6R0_9ZZZZ
MEVTCDFLTVISDLPFNIEQILFFIFFKFICFKMYGDKKIFITALVFAAIIFLFGLLVGNYIVTSKMDEVRLSEESFIIDLLGMEMQDEISDEHFCELDVEKSLRKKMVLGKMLTTLEERLGKENKDIIQKKEIYELIQIKIIKNLEKMKNECNRSNNILIYFYTNKQNDVMGSADDCNDESKIIENVVYDVNERIKKNESDVMYNKTDNNIEYKSNIYVFAFDINSENLATYAMLKKYEIKKVPATIINDKKYDYLSKEDLTEILEKELALNYPGKENDSR